MPIRYAEDSPPTAVFEGHCAPEEADGLLEWLRRTSEPAANLRACEAPHTALVQLLLAAKVRLAAAPADPILAACLEAHLPYAANTPPAAEDQPRGRGTKNPSHPKRRTQNAKIAK